MISLPPYFPKFLNGWLDVQNASAAPNEIRRTQLGQTPNFRRALLFELGSVYVT